MNGIICRAITSGNYITEKIQDGIITKLPDQLSDSISTVLLNDKKYGLLRPRDGKSFSYKILSLDKEVTERQVVRAVSSALFNWHLHLNLDYHKCKSNELPDITIQFKSIAEDPTLNTSTLAYMYYPLGGKTNGVMVINTMFYWTNNGEGIDMYFIDPIHYPTPGSSKNKGETHDLDKVLTHEFGHGIFGLPHLSGTMAPRYDLMEEYLDEETIFRASQKIPKRNMIESKFKRLLAHLKIRSER